MPINYTVETKLCVRFGVEFCYAKAISADGQIIAHTTANSEEVAKNNLNIIIFRDAARREREERQKANASAGLKKYQTRTIDYRLLR
jgi:hypothetical protein